MHLLVDAACRWLLFTPTQILVLLLSSEGNHVLLKDVASLGRVSKVLHMVEGAGLAAGCYRETAEDQKALRLQRNSQSLTFVQQLLAGREAATAVPHLSASV